jgi:hypothetical protein
LRISRRVDGKNYQQSITDPTSLNTCKRQIYNIGDITEATGMTAGRFIALTIFIDKEGSGKDPMTLRIEAAYYDATTTSRSGAGCSDEANYHTDSNCLFTLTDCAIMVQAAEPHRVRKMDNLQHAMGGERARAYTTRQLRRPHQRDLPAPQRTHDRRTSART